MRKGFFITFEGPEGSGKSTQAQKLKKALLQKGYSVTLVREPGATRVGEEIRQVLLRKGEEITPLTELLLYQAARAQNTRENIIPRLKKGEIVISDRYAESSLAYQGYGRGLAREDIEQINMLACDNLRPDLTILLDIEPEAGLKRLKKNGFDRLEGETIDFHRRVREGYLKLSRDLDYFWKLNAKKPQEELEREILTEVLKLITNRVQPGKEAKS